MNRKLLVVATLAALSGIAAAEDARNATGQVAVGMEGSVDEAKARGLHAPGDVGQERSADEARDRGLHAPGEVEEARKTGADIGTGIADGSSPAGIAPAAMRVFSATSSATMQITANTSRHP